MMCMIYIGLSAFGFPANGYSAVGSGVCFAGNRLTSGLGSLPENVVRLGLRIVILNPHKVVCAQNSLASFAKLTSAEGLPARFALTCTIIAGA